MAILEHVLSGLHTIDREAYALHEADSRARLSKRDPDDWPVAAVALTFGCPIWTEDSDFFGCGIPTWTSDRVEIYLRSLQEGQAAEV